MRSGTERKRRNSFRCSRTAKRATRIRIATCPGRDPTAILSPPGCCEPRESTSSCPGRRSGRTSPEVSGFDSSAARHAFHRGLVALEEDELRRRIEKREQRAALDARIADAGELDVVQLAAQRVLEAIAAAGERARLALAKRKHRAVGREQRSEELRNFR